MSWRPPASSFVALATVAALLAGPAGCASPPPGAPALQPTLGHRAGGPLGAEPAAAGALVAPDAEPDEAWSLAIEWLWLPEGEGEDLVPAGAHAQAVVGSGAFGATPRLDDTVRVALGEGARDVAARLRATPEPGASVIARQAGALPAGVSAVAGIDALSIELSRPPEAGAGAELALVREGQVPIGAARSGGVEVEAATEDEDEEGDEAESGAVESRRRAAQEPVAWRDVLLLDVPLQPDGPPAVIALPGGPPGTALVAVIELRAAPQDDEGRARHAELVAACLDDVALSAERDLDRAAAVDAAESKHRQLLAAARSMAEAGDRRRAGVFLASESGAELTLDTLLAADEPSLAALGAAWRQAAGADLEALVRGDSLAWSLERTAALWLVQAAEAGTLPAELESVLLRQTGVAGRAPSLLQQFAEDSEGLADWRARLEEENRLALEDHLPAARVRAYDWLVSRGLAPSGYDPLASRAERQAALVAADEVP